MKGEKCVVISSFDKNLFVVGWQECFLAISIHIISFIPIVLCDTVKSTRSFLSTIYAQHMVGAPRGNLGVGYLSPGALQPEMPGLGIEPSTPTITNVLP